MIYFSELLRIHAESGETGEVAMVRVANRWFS